MSYCIERGKRVLTFKTDDERFHCNGLGEFLLFIVSSSDNNVYPRSYDWSVVAHDYFSEWNKEIQLPPWIWEVACGADGGGVKPYNRDISGVAYIKSWKQAVKQRRPAITPDGRLLWHPNISLWADQERRQEIDSKGSETFSPTYKHLRQPLYDAFKRLFPKPLNSSSQWFPVLSREAFLDAVFLYVNRTELPFTFYLTDREDSRFLRSCEQQEFLVAA